MWNKTAAVAGWFLIGATPGWAEQPLSAIDWLSQSVATPAAMPIPQIQGQAITSQPDRKRDISTGAAVAPIAVQKLDGPKPDAVGLLATSTTGLPRKLWGTTPESELARMLRAERVDTLPSVQALLYTLLLAEVDPPVDADGRGALLLARVDKLLDLGALDQASALLDLAGTDDADRFRRAFDIALLLGTEDRLCAPMLKSPGIAPTLTARIFCLARGGDWNAAAVTLRTAEALGQITSDENALLSRFLDPDMFEGEPALPAPIRPTPLVWRMLEALGEPIATSTLPVAFAHADLRSNTGWKAQIEAAERLSRTAAIAPTQLIALYTQSAPSASGGVWDRVKAVQDFDLAMTRKDSAAVARTLPAAWDAMTQIELEAAFAELYGAELATMTLPVGSQNLANTIGLLSPEYETVAIKMVAMDNRERFAQGIARGSVTGLPTSDSLTRAIAAGFSATDIAADDAALLAQGRLGEALLKASDGITQGVKGNLRDVSTALALLRHVGLESPARRIALELMLLERRG